MTDQRRGEFPTPWRTGRKVGRTIYDASDQLIGVMDTVDAAQRVVEAVTERDALRDAIRNAPHAIGCGLSPQSRAECICWKSKAVALARTQEDRT